MGGSYKRKRSGIVIPKSSIVLNLKPVFAARNIVHPYAYLLKIGINTTTANKMLKGEAIQLNFNQMTLLCVNLNCTPNDLLALRAMSLPSHHELNKIKPLENNEESVMTVNEWLSHKSVDEVHDILKKDLS
ncbi:helix-turn-helix domain-containing protein [Flavobacterium sp. N3904]|uniref:helix-turn-helix domain-containing protein n=1 Tax=Flavobacterium sp. N3904 TaxID=2986835 RepID=UPI0022254A71|nr:helix-turn-helix transcriptional regulator [Flavobacterium sp. N3904]